MNYMRGPHAPVMPDYGMHHPPMPAHPSLPGYPRMMPDDRNGGAPVVPERGQRRPSAASYRPYPDPHRRDMTPGSYGGGGYPPSNPYPPASRGPMNGSPLMPATSLMPPHGSTPPLGHHHQPSHDSYGGGHPGHPSSILSGPPMPGSASASPFQTSTDLLHSPLSTNGGGSLPNPMSWSGTPSTTPPP
ncbi:hypothetical protein DL96DRAFT_1090000 [Flagelloscypha sp. PMI_526]|nr:hypothetical protein DL96DRAFT_1090000 [Flagelloscypha sp. PMI_526]